MPYEAKLEAAGGQAPLMWRLEGDLPDGMSFAVETAEMREVFFIRGTPGQESVTALLITAHDASGRIAETAFGLRVLPAQEAPKPMFRDEGCGCTASNELRCCRELQKSWACSRGFSPPNCSISAAGAVRSSGRCSMLFRTCQ